MTKHGYNVSPAYNFAKRLNCRTSEVLLLTYHCTVLSTTPQALRGPAPGTGSTPPPQPRARRQRAGWASSSSRASCSQVT